jgi:glycosyltransferase involved in cell wall biosynthesis
MSELRPLLLVANSSWYLFHYRQLLLSRLRQKSQHVIALSPVDSSTPALSKLLIHIPWRIHRSTDSSPLSLGVSFLRLLFLVRAIKPRLVHSHTLKANLLVAVVTAFFGVPCVLSFAGMGRLSKASGLSRQAFVFVLRTIAFFAFYKRRSRWGWEPSPSRSIFIFQNPIDRLLFEQTLPKLSSNQNYLIPGSGVPVRYFSETAPLTDQLFPNQWWNPALDQHHSSGSCHQFLFCGRLLISKGIVTFLEIAALLDRQQFTVFGGFDPSSRDSLLIADLPALQVQHPNVIFAGSISDPLLHLHFPFPVLLVPSNYGEGLPRAIAEALALGIPVISSQSATCGIFDSSTIYIADGDSPDCFLKCIDDLFADHAYGRLIPRLLAGKALVASSLSEESVVDQTLDVYTLFDDDLHKSYLLSKDDARLGHWLSQ